MEALRVWKFENVRLHNRDGTQTWGKFYVRAPDENTAIRTLIAEHPGAVPLRPTPLTDEQFSAEHVSWGKNEFVRLVSGRD
jgi:hypothetical protein